MKPVPGFFLWGVGVPCGSATCGLVTLGDCGRAGVPVLIIQQMFLKHLLCGQMNKTEFGVQWRRWAIYKMVT